MARGFTLLELLVVLLVVGLMAAVAAPAFLAERPEADLVEAQGRIDALFRMARDSAVRTGTPVTVTVDSTSGLVWFDARSPLASQLPPGEYGREGGAGAAEGEHAPGGGGGGPAAGGGRLTTSGSFGGGSTLGRTAGASGGGRGVPERGESLDLPSSVEMELFHARGRFTFLPSGAAMGDSLLLRTSTGEVRLVTLDPWTGRARIR
jgi:prepilin-type N-terminal cleavage/methylation domain-containing protein